MPASKIRKHHHQHHPVAKRERPVKYRRAALAAMMLFAILGFVIGYFASGGDPLSFVIATIIGAVAGYITGHMMDKSLEKK